MTGTGVRLAACSWVAALAVLAMGVVLPALAEAQDNVSASIVLEPAAGQICPTDVLVQGQEVDIAVSIHNISTLGGVFVPAEASGTTTVILSCEDTVCSIVADNKLDFVSCTPEAGVASCEMGSFTVGSDTSKTAVITYAEEGATLAANTTTRIATIRARAVAGQQFPVLCDSATGAAQLNVYGAGGVIQAGDSAGAISSGSAPFFYPDIFPTPTPTSTPSSTPQTAGCRVTGGRQITIEGNPVGDFEFTKATGGGQVGAPCGCIGCFDEFDHVQGNWQHSRKKQQGRFKAMDYNSLVCACEGVTVADTKWGQLCSADELAAQPRKSPANLACFSGTGLFATSGSGKKDVNVSFRVEVEDRGEPSQGKDAAEDFYRIRIWIPTGTETLKTLAAGACCTNANPIGAAARAADIDDGGNLLRGNIRIHPRIRAHTDVCPIAGGLCGEAPPPP